jgi:PAS domain
LAFALSRPSAVRRRILATAASEGKFEGEGWRLRKDGSRFWANVIIDPIRDTAGNLIGFAKITRDLTERPAAEATLRASQEQFRRLVQGVTDYSLYMLDPDGKVASWNAGAQSRVIHHDHRERCTSVGLGSAPLLFAPSKHHSLEGREHGRTIPLADLSWPLLCAREFTTHDSPGLRLGLHSVLAEERQPYVNHIETSAASASQIAPKSASDNSTTTSSRQYG